MSHSVKLEEGKWIHMMTLSGRGQSLHRPPTRIIRPRGGACPLQVPRAWLFSFLLPLAGPALQFVFVFRFREELLVQEPGQRGAFLAVLWGPRLLQVDQVVVRLAHAGVFLLVPSAEKQLCAFV